MSYDLIRLKLSAQADKSSTWPAIETAYPFKKYISDKVCELLRSGGWNELNRSVFSTVKNHNPEKLIFQYISLKKSCQPLRK